MGAGQGSASPAARELWHIGEEESPQSTIGTGSRFVFLFYYLEASNSENSDVLKTPFCTVGFRPEVTKSKRHVNAVSRSTYLAATEVQEDGFD